jgi:hypothetical protein
LRPVCAVQELIDERLGGTTLPVDELAAPAVASLGPLLDPHPAATASAGTIRARPARRAHAVAVITPPRSW